MAIELESASFFSLSFNCDNSAFADDFREEITGILMKVATKIKAGETNGSIRDTNGNKIGEFNLE